jgi:hypothetical protein
MVYGYGANGSLAIIVGVILFDYSVKMKFIALK